jgi:hypothetical protein
VIPAILALARVVPLAQHYSSVSLETQSLAAILAASTAFVFALDCSTKGAKIDKLQLHKHKGYDTVLPEFQHVC